MCQCLGVSRPREPASLRSTGRLSKDGDVVCRDGAGVHRCAAPFSVGARCSSEELSCYGQSVVGVCWYSLGWGLHCLHCRTVLAP